MLRNLTRLLLALCCLASGAVAAAGDTLLIQLQPDASYRVWYSDGPRHLTDDELNQLAATASAEGGETTTTSAGGARAYQLAHAVLISFADDQPDGRQLLDRDACGGMRVWHSTGQHELSDNDLTDLVLSALPDGGKRVLLGHRYGKAFQTSLGVVAVIWQTGR
jgi:hypothetical protein